MSLKAGIVGLPNVGKSTLFNAITNSQVEAANYPFATIEPNVGIVEVPDLRIDKLVEMVEPQKVIKATFEFIDIAGLVSGASKGEGLGNKFLSNIRETDAIIQVVRCFENKDITHVSNSINPIRDIEVINLELLLADIQTIDNIIKRIEGHAKNTNDRNIKFEYDLAIKLKKALEAETPIRKLNLSSEEIKQINQYQLLTQKPLLYIGNVDEEFAGQPEKSSLFQELHQYATKEKCLAIGMSIKIESELSELDHEDKQIFMKDFGIEYPILNKLINNSFKLLNLSTYFTVGKKEVHAWPFMNGLSAPQCARIIHTDFQKHFIKAEVISYDDFVKYDGEQGTKSAGKIRLEGKEYIMQDGDICNFKVNA